MDWREKEKEKNAKQINEAYQDENGIFRWKSNSRVPFDDMLGCWNLDDETLAACREARDKDNEVFIAEYRKSMENYEYSDEEKFEMRAAFGEGAEVVNVLTGKKIRL